MIEHYKNKDLAHTFWSMNTQEEQEDDCYRRQHFFEDEMMCIRLNIMCELCVPKPWGGTSFRRIRDFNIALLGNQAWRLVQFPNSLLSKLYKAKYYPSAAFLEAKLGSNPSFIWRSILEAQTVLKQGYRWRLGDGSSINVWKEPWLPNDDLPFIQTPMPDSLHDLHVDSLFNISKTAWVLDILNALFISDDVNLIWNIPIEEVKHPDRIIWAENEKGLYTGKSCFRKLPGHLHVDQIPFWTKVWKMRLPPRIKLFFGSFVRGLFLQWIF